jgi:hypothetical protein
VKDLELLQRWGTHLDPPGGMPPPTLRARVLNHQPARMRRHPAVAARIAWSLAAFTALALAVTGSVLATRNPHSAQVPGRGSVAAPPPVTGTRILHNAALVVGQQPVAAPRADQFVFTEGVNTDIRTVNADGKVTSRPGTPQLFQLWNSVDGTRNGLAKARPVAGTGWIRTDTVSACRNGRMPLVGSNGKIIPGRYESMRCQPIPAFLPGLPTAAQAMLTWLYTKGGAGEVPVPDRSVAAFNAAFELIERYYLTPATKAALFEALSRLPGVTVQTDVVDLAGRHGVAVRVPPSTAASPGSSAKVGQLIFDPVTYAFLGTTYFAILRQAIVDSPGQLPS